MTTVRDALAAATERLAGAGIGSARLDAELLLAHVLGVPRSRLALEPSLELADGDRARLDAFLARRVSRRPVAQILGGTEFWSLDLHVSSAVLCPRPETEQIVEVAARFLREEGRPGARAVDVGTGTGCIAIALATELRDLRVDAVDVSGDALEVAARNVERHEVGDRVTLHRGDLLEPLAGAPPGCVDVVASNPPYVRRGEAGELDPEVLWDPAVAVFCEGDPAPLYARIARDAARLLRPGGLLLLELPGAGSEPILDAVRGQASWETVEALPDLQGLPRVLRARRVTGS